MEVPEDNREEVLSMKPVEFQALKVVELKKNVQILKYFLNFTKHQKNLKYCIRLRLSMYSKHKFLPGGISPGTPG